MDLVTSLDFAAKNRHSRASCVLMGPMEMEFFICDIGVLCEEKSDFDVVWLAGSHFWLSL